MGESIKVKGNYEVFKVLTDEYANNSPQNQGLTQEEYADALSDPEVSSTDVVYEDCEFAIPQLAPVTANHWLNDTFYQKQFPAAFDSGNLLNYVDIPNVSAGQSVRDRLAELAANQGVLVFDYPDFDEKYPDRVAQLLDDLGIKQEEITELGVQTYFAGQTSLKKEFERDYPVAQPINDTFADLIKDGEYDNSRLLNGASVQRLVKPIDAEHMLKFYEHAYEVLNDDPCRQGLDPEEFMSMMTEDETVAKIVRTVNGRIAALCLLENDLTKLSWVNSEYYRQRYQDKYEAGQIVWFPGLAADPKGDVGNNTQIMVNLIAELGYKSNNDMLVVFDCCQKNTGFLDVFLQAMINETPHASIKIDKIASQRYCAIQTSLKQ